MTEQPGSVKRMVGFYEGRIAELEEQVDAARTDLAEAWTLIWLEDSQYVEGGSRKLDAWAERMQTKYGFDDDSFPGSVPENEGMTDHQHKPVVRKINPFAKSPERHIVCGVCGLLLDFRSLESLGFNTEDWEPAEQNQEHRPEGQ